LKSFFARLLIVFEGKLGTGGVVCVKTEQAIVVGTYKKPGKAIVVVEKLGEYLRESGF
jgi:profilin